MSEVACVFGPAVDELRERGLADQLVAGLGVGVEQLSDPRQRISWDAFTVFARRAVDLLGESAFEEAAFRATEAALPAFLCRMLGRFATPRPAYLLGARWWGPWIFRPTRATCEELADGRLREVIEILPGYRESPEFFRAVRGLLRATPRLFGQPEAVVDLREDGRRAEFIIATPPPRRRRFRRTRAPNAQLPSELEELGFRQEQLRESEQRCRVSAVLLADKTRRLAALDQLAGALTRCSEVRDRLAAVMRILDGSLSVGGIRLSGLGAAGDPGAADLNAETGVLVGNPCARLAIPSGAGTLGMLELWSPRGLSREDEERLRDWLPWVGVALESAGAVERVGQLTRLLEDDVADWHRVGEALEEVLPDREGSLSLFPSLRRAAEAGVGTALLVEERPRMRERGRRLLEEAGFHVVEASCRSDALLARGDEAAAQLLVADWSGSALDVEFLRDVQCVHRELRGILLLPFERGTVVRSTSDGEASAEEP